MTSRLTRPSAHVFGWSTLLAGLAIPSVMSVNAIVLFWTLPCTEGVHWAATPLIAGCEPLSPSQSALGWTATILSLIALACATAVAAYGGAAFIRARDKRRALPCLLFPSAVVPVAAVIAVVLLANPDARFHAAGAWITVSSLAGLATAVTAAIAALVIRLALVPTDSDQPSRRTGLSE